MITEAWFGLHEDSRTALRCVVRSDVDGVLKARVNGIYYTGEAMEVAGDGYVGRVDIPGLVANTEYEVYLALADGEDTLIGKTSPDGGNFFFLVGSCFNPDMAMVLGEYYADKGAVFFMAEGDQIYVDKPAEGSDITNPGVETKFGISLRSISWYSDDLSAEPSDVQYLREYHNHYRVYWNTPGFKDLIRTTPTLQTTDDHTWPGNDGARNAGAELSQGLNWYRGVGNADAGANGAFCKTQADADKHWQFGIDAYRAWAKGNPASADVDSRVELPVPYLKAERLYYDFVIGSVHFIVLECMAFRDVVSEDTDDVNSPLLDGKGIDDATKRMLDISDIWGGSTQPQMEWLETLLKNSNSTFKCILSSKETIGGQDGWKWYGVDKARFLAYLLESVSGNSAEWNVPGGCFAISGDTHKASYLYDADNKHLQARACPSGTHVTSTIGKEPTAFYYDESNTQKVLVKVEVNEDAYIDVKLIGNANRVLASRRILAGENETAVFKTKIAI